MEYPVIYIIELQTNSFDFYNNVINYFILNKPIFMIKINKAIWKIFIINLMSYKWISKVKRIVSTPINIIIN